MTGKADALRSNLAEPKASPGLDPGDASVKPVVVDVKPKKLRRPRKVEADEPDLIAAK
jgi:hypothetical protein